jgi:hypothetical protein
MVVTRDFFFFVTPYTSIYYISNFARLYMIICTVHSYFFINLGFLVCENRSI